MRFRTDDRPGSLFWVVTLMFVHVQAAQAYADPGSGMLIWQVVGAFFVGCAYQARKFFTRFRKKK